MTALIPRESPRATPMAPVAATPPSRLLAGIYHDIGMAAVANVLKLPIETLDAEAHESVKRGCRYIFLMPKRPEAPQSPR